MTKNEKIALKDCSEYARQSGFYKGSLDGVMMQMKDCGTHYELPSEVFRKAQESLEKFKLTIKEVL